MISNIENGLNEAHERIESALAEIDNEGEVTEDSAVTVLLAVSDLMDVLRMMRGAGADIAEAPVEEEAILTVLANGDRIIAEMQKTVAFIQGVVERVRPAA